MRGHITRRTYKNKKGEIVKSPNLTIVVDLEKEPNGKRRQKSYTFKGTERQAEKKLTEILRQIDTGMYVEPNNQKFSEYLENWLRDYATPNCSPKTLEGYEIIINRHVIPSIGKYRMANLKPEHLQHYYSEKLESGLSAQTIKHHHSVLHKALQSAVEWQIIPRNIADAVKPPKVKRIEMQVWNQAEIQQFLNTCEGSQYYELFYLALATGMRRGELLALRWQDIDLIYGQVSVNRSLHVLPKGKVIFTAPKTASGRRTIALPPSATLLLAEYHEKMESEYLMLDKHLSDNDLVFSTLGKPMLSNSVSHAWHKLVIKAGVKPIRLHDSRHSHASLMLAQGVHPKVVQERLGHSSIVITLDTYSHVAPGLQAAAAKQFDAVFKVSDNENDSVSKRLANSKTKVV